MFCSVVGVGPERWGTPAGDPEQEYKLFMEWLSELQKDPFSFNVFRGV